MFLFLLEYKRIDCFCFKTVSLKPNDLKMEIGTPVSCKISMHTCMETSFYVIFLLLLVYTCSTEIIADGYVWVDVPSGGGLVEYNLLRKSKRGIICTYYNCKQSNCDLFRHQSR